MHLNHFDSWIADGGPSALTLKEHLEPAGGVGDVIFPPTFAPPEGSKDPAGYIIDGEGEDSICLIDSVGSQSNRLEPLFAQPPYASLVPQVTITVEERTVSLLELGHRAADAVARSTDLADEIHNAFQSYSAGDGVPLARLAPTSIVFGAWDSRDTAVKIPRLVNSTIRAYNVRKHGRAAQYFGALEGEEVENALEGVKIAKDRKKLSGAGFLDAPSGHTHGGVTVHGDIVRTTILNLTALRALGAAENEPLALRRYILSLGLIAALAPIDLFLRQGCLLVQSESKPPQLLVVHRNGKREGSTISPDDVQAYAETAAAAFGVGKDRAATFGKAAATKVYKKALKAKDTD